LQPSLPRLRLSCRCTGSLDTIKWLLQHGIDEDNRVRVCTSALESFITPTYSGEGTFISAKRNPHEEIIDYLLHNGARPSVEFLVRAVRSGSEAITALQGLFRQHGSILSPDEQDLTIIDSLLAGSHGVGHNYSGDDESYSLQLLPCFFDHGVSAVYKNRWLQKAAERGFLQVIRLLVDNQADPLACNAEGKTAVDIARANLVKAAQQKPPISKSHGFGDEKWKECLDVAHFLEHGLVLTVEEYYMKGFMTQEEAGNLSRAFRNKYETIRVRELIAKNRKRHRDRLKVEGGDTLEHEATVKDNVPTGDDAITGNEDQTLVRPRESGSRTT
jgi:hypothetical protein